jgi:hypothetical protein
LWVITEFHRCVCARFVFYWHHAYCRWWAKGVRNVVRIWQRKKLFFNLVYVFKLWGRVIHSVSHGRRKHGRQFWRDGGERVPPSFFRRGDKYPITPPPHTHTLFNMFNEVLFLGNLKT